MCSYCFVDLEVIYSGRCSLGTWEECVFCCCFMDHYVYARSSRYIVQFKTSVLLLIQWLFYGSWMWGIKFSDSYWGLCISSFNCVYVYLIYFETWCLVYIFLIVIYPWQIDYWQYIMSFFVSCSSVWLIFVIIPTFNLFWL